MVVIICKSLGVGSKSSSSPLPTLGVSSCSSLPGRCSMILMMLAVVMRVESCMTCLTSMTDSHPTLKGLASPRESFASPLANVQRLALIASCQWYGADLAEHDRHATNTVYPTQPYWSLPFLRHVQGKADLLNQAKTKAHYHLLDCRPRHRRQVRLVGRCSRKVGGAASRRPRLIMCHQACSRPSVVC